MQEFLQHFEATVMAKGGKEHLRLLNESVQLLAMVLPVQVEIQAGDGLHGGAAVRIEGEALTLYAYFLRQICTNGMVHVFKETRHATFQTGEKERFVAELDTTLADLGQHILPAQGEALRHSIGRPISLNEVFRAARLMGARVQHIQPRAEAADSPFMRGLQALEARRRRLADMRHTDRHDRNQARLLSERLLQEVERELARPVNARRARRGMTAFDLINGITAMARDERDPRTQVAWMQLAQEILVTGSARMILPEDEGEAALHLETFVAG